jgi:hypothetical protein
MTRTRSEMAHDGREAAAHALLGKGAVGALMESEDYEAGLTDALVNLMHFADRYELDFYDRLDNARTHFLVEKTYDWDEEPGIDPKEAT